MCAQNHNSQWYVDSGYSINMTEEKSMFVSLDEIKIRNVTFKNYAVGRIRGKGTIILTNGRG